MDLKPHSTALFERLCCRYADALEAGPADGHSLRISAAFFPALAAWLAGGQHPWRINCRGGSIDLERIVRAMLRWACDREPSADTEGLLIAYGLWLLRDTLLPTLPEKDIASVQRWLASVSSASPPPEEGAALWLQMRGLDAAQSQEVTARVREQLRDLPCFFGANGACAGRGEYAALASALVARHLGLWPHSAGMLKRLVRLHLSWYEQAALVERHAGCMLPLVALWQIADDDPLWSTAEDPIPVEQDDFVRAIRPAGWLLCGTRATGHVRRYSLDGVGWVYSPTGMAKPVKFLQSSHFPANETTIEGDWGPDCALCLTDGGHFAHPTIYESLTIGDEHLRAVCRLTLGDMIVPCDTILLPHGEGHVRVHRLQVPAANAAFTIREGGAPLGYSDDEPIEKAVDVATQTSTAAARGRLSLIRGIHGYERALIPQSFRGRDDLSTAFDHAVTPLLESSVPAAFGRELVLTCYALATPRARADMPPLPQVTARWLSDGTVRITCDAREINVKP